MKLVAGISSAALLCLLSLSNGVQQNAVSAFVPAVPSTTHILPSNNAITNAMRYETSLNAEAIKITMPALSSTMKEGRVVSWLKEEGDEIEAGEAIMVVESDFKRTSSSKRKEANLFQKNVRPKRKRRSTTERE